MRKLYLGVTFIELMITIIIAGVILVAAVGGFRAFVQQNKARTLATKFTRTLAFARSEAIKRSVPVTICALNDNSDTCGNNWSFGWMVYAEEQGGVGNLANNEPIFIVMRRASTTAAANKLPVTFSALAGNSIITYQPTGFTSTGAGDYEMIPKVCAGKIAARRVTLFNTGRSTNEVISCP